MFLSQLLRNRGCSSWTLFLSLGWTTRGVRFIVVRCRSISPFSTVVPIHCTSYPCFISHYKDSNISNNYKIFPAKSTKILPEICVKSRTKIIQTCCFATNLTTSFSIVAIIFWFFGKSRSPLCIKKGQPKLSDSEFYVIAVRVSAKISCHIN